MKKILSLLTLVIILISPAYCNCAKDLEGVVTGGACSISELNEMSAEKKMKSENVKPFKDLRPLRQDFYLQKINSDTCLFGNCISKQLYNRKMF